MACKTSVSDLSPTFRYPVGFKTGEKEAFSPFVTKYSATIQRNIVILRSYLGYTYYIMAEKLSNNDGVILGIDPGTNVLGYGVLEVKGRSVNVLALGVIDLRKVGDVYAKLGHIFKRVSSIVESFHPQEMAIEAPFMGKNIQSTLKLGRAQGVAIAAAMEGGLTVHEYAPRKIKMALTGNGSASKEQVSGMLQKILQIDDESMVPFLDATDALAAAYCHFLQRGIKVGSAGYKGWGDFVRKNASRVKSPSAIIKN